ncbi:MAG: hypothetical protein JNM67_00100 [Bacteroidetes bacterium]|nr:hypothetical protein [Bacteroidota bacterium]
MFKYLSFLLIVLVACKGGHKADYEVQAELQMLDTLQARLLTVKSWIDKVDLREIQERKDIIDHNLQYIQNHFVESNTLMTPETALLLDEYKNYGKLYKKASDSFKPLVMELEELFIQTKTLKESAHSKDYKKETFLTYFQKEKEDVLKLYDYATMVQRPVVETDLAFERAQQRVEQLAEELKIKRPPMDESSAIKAEGEEE